MKRVFVLCPILCCVLQQPSFSTWIMWPAAANALADGWVWWLCWWWSHAVLVPCLSRMAVAAVLCVGVEV